jgi:hypothetical protein
MVVNLFPYASAIACSSSGVHAGSDAFGVGVE